MPFDDCFYNEEHGTHADLALCSSKDESAAMEEADSEQHDDSSCILDESDQDGMFAELNDLKGVVSFLMDAFGL